MTGPEPTAAERLARHRFVAGLDAEFVAELSRLAKEVSYPTGGLLVREGAPAEEFLLLVDGKVALEIAPTDRPRTTIQTIGRDEVLGWSWLVPPHRWRLDARALKSTRAVALPAAPLRALLDARPADAYRFLRRLLPVIAERLENTRLQLVDLHG